MTVKLDLPYLSLETDRHGRRPNILRPMSSAVSTPIRN
jgi:hypothetical protein